MRQGIAHLLAVDLDICHIVLEDGGDVDLGELVLAEDDEKARLATGPVTHDNQLLADRCHPLEFDWVSEKKAKYS